MPVVVWSRLYFDLEPYLTERSADGASLLAFYHRQVGKVTTDEFLGDDNRRLRHESLARYFTEQALHIEKDGKKTPNLRKVSELPYQQTYGEMWGGLEETLCDLRFIEAKCTAAMTYDLAADYNRLGIGRAQPGPPIRTAWSYENRFGACLCLLPGWAAHCVRVMGRDPQGVGCPDRRGSRHVC